MLNESAVDGCSEFVNEISIRVIESGGAERGLNSGDKFHLSALLTLD